MTDYKTLSDSELTEALNFHRRQRNMSRGINESAHMRQTQIVRLLEAEEARRLNEEVEQIDELSKKTLGSYVKKASTDQYLKGQAVQYHTNKAQTADGAFTKQSKEKHYDAADKALKKASNRDTGIGRAVDRLAKEEVEQIDEISASTLQSYVDKARDSKKAEMKNRTAAKNDMKKYGMAMDKKAHDDAARKVVNRNTGISVANKKLNTYPTDKAKAKVMAREEVEQIDEISDDLKAKYLDKAVQQRYDRFVTPRNTSAPKPKGAAKKAADAAREKANAKDTRRAGIIDKTAEKLTGKPHYHKMSTMTTPAVHGNADDWWKGKKYSKEEAELDEASYRDIGYANMLKADRKAEKELAKLRAQQEKAKAKAAAKASKPEEFKEEADLRITKVYNKWPKPATYAVHNADRSYHKEFDSMEAAKAHKAEKSK